METHPVVHPPLQNDLYFQANRTQSFQVSNLFLHLNKEFVVERLVVGLLKS